MGRSPIWVFLHSETYPEGKSFAEMLEWHIYWGIQPHQPRSAIREHTQIKQLAWKVYEGYPENGSYDPSQNVLNWRKGAFPENQHILTRLLDVLFDADPALAKWRFDLQEAWDEKRKSEDALVIEERGLEVSSGSLPIADLHTIASIPRLTYPFIGRVDDVEDIVSLFLSAPQANRIVVQGGPAVGKTEIIKAVRHHSDIVHMFGSRRCFVSVRDEAVSDSIWSLITRAIGCGDAIKIDTIADIITMPSLLILDGLDDRWNIPEKKEELENTLYQLSTCKKLYVLASFRGNEFISTFNYIKTIKPLGMDSARDLFAEIAGRWVLQDTHLNGLLKELGGIPLAVVLVAKRAFGRVELADILAEWKEIGVEMAAIPETRVDHTTSLKCAI